MKLGLDIGIGSVGWSLVDTENETIIASNVRTFPVAEGAEDRRLKRSARVLNDRKKKRMKKLKRLMNEQGILMPEGGDPDVWRYRAEGLDRVLEDHEFGSALFHLSKRRGYRSNRREETDEDGKVTLEAIRANAELLEEKGYRTMGEMFYRDERFREQKRNQPGHYLTNVYRSHTEEEIRFLFKRQRELGNRKATETFEESFVEIWGEQLPFATVEGMMEMAGECSLLPGELRAPKASYTFQYFRLLQELHTLRIEKGEEYRGLTDSEREALIPKLMKRRKTTYHQLRKDLTPLFRDEKDWRFAGITYDPEHTLKKNESDVFLKLEDLHDLKKAVGEGYDKTDLDTFAFAITVCKETSQLHAYLRNEYLSKEGEYIRNHSNRDYGEEVAENLIPLRASGFGHLSLKAMNRLIPHMEKGYDLSGAMEEEGFKKEVQKEKPNRLPPVPPIGNRAVMRALTQARKVVNSLIKTYGVPDRITVEFARDLSQSDQERMKESRRNKQNRAKNEGIVSTIEKSGKKNVTGHDIKKVKLWEEQGKRCLYSGKPISLKEVLSDKTEVDHIIPFSRSFDDSYHNLVLVFSSENQNKGNKIPTEFMNETQWNDLKRRVEGELSHLSSKKKELLLKPSFTGAQEEEWKARHLNDTAYIAKAFTGLLRDHIDCSVHATNGRMTSLLRKRWELTKEREHSDIHHALDATIIAVTDGGMIQAVTRYYKHNKKESDLAFPLPWETFIEDLLSHLDGITVSRMPDRSAKGEGHEAKVRSLVGKTEAGLYTTAVRKPLSDLTFDGNGDFPMLGKEDGEAVYGAIKKRYLTYLEEKKHYDSLSKGEKKGLQKPEPFRDPLIVDGVPVKSVKVTENAGRIRHVNGGVVYSGDMFRVDLFEKDGKISLVPVYVIDWANGVLPNRAAVPKKGYESWPEIDDTHEFLFSLHRNDLVEVTMTGEKKIPLKSGGVRILHPGEKVKMMYNSTLTSSASLRFHFPDRSNADVFTLSFKRNPPRIKKLQIDPIGRIGEVKNEKRRALS
ncbi:type II CRISPR RNA-guided endonuclease Cas9 (plasmid) [Pontibacillus sp. ALD_SL1]|uniref:type II CRISPR RNA-guided endonuclease Cas9 n=1 Tax=Pontibacillus sp. ALD_SL1 TaxID=2777185 RepID=UPI001A95B330|nr:type II CRISPR RNA-guided endonuclease Cas9 [Pontibacillus sp. ALD_SL1]QST02446.1 type II CRISPR RNA-guided endonuclease Cas9 [Pontibacillus sp. ALD_SL1]